MRKSTLLFFITVTILSCQKKLDLRPQVTEENSQIQPQTRCGMEEAMAAMPKEWRDEMLASAHKTTVATSEILLYLDFDGALVLPGSPNPSGYRSPIISGVRNCPAPSLNASQIAAVIELVEDDFSPFNIRVTTDITEFNNYAPANNKHICIITTIPQVIGMSAGVGGVAPWAGPQSRLPFNPSFVFANVYGGNLAEIASTVSHEVGHTMGLDHQRLFNESCGFVTEYHPGFGTGALGFAPIMGLGGKRVSNWFAQPCINPFYGGTQNDFEFLTSQVTVKEDDYPDSPGGSTQNATEITGILEEEGDVDFIRINFRNPGPVIITSENIDIKASLYNPGGGLLGEYNDPGDTHATIPLANGMRYLKIEAVSNPNMSAQFMTGKYKISY